MLQVLLLASYATCVCVANFPTTPVRFPPFTSRFPDKHDRKYRTVFGQLVQLSELLLQEIRYRKLSFSQYRTFIRNKIDSTYQGFIEKQTKSMVSARADLSENLNKLNQAYNETLLLLKTTMEDIDRVGSKSTVIRPSIFDNSLEDFQRFYNESIYAPNEKKLTALLKQWNRGVVYRGQLDELHQLKFNQRIRKLTDNLKQQLDGATKAIVTNRDIIGLLKIDDANLSSEISKLQEELIANSKAIFEASQRSIQDALSKGSIRLEEESLDGKLAQLDRQRAEWIRERSVQVEVLLKSVQERLRMTDSAYEELQAKKSLADYYCTLTDATLSKALKLIREGEKGWSLIREEDGIKVWRKIVRSDSKYALVKATGVLAASPKRVFELLEDNTRVKEYNDFFDKGWDVEEVAENTKVVWASSQPVFPFKARDFCTIVHFRNLRDGTIIVLNKATDHPLAPKSGQYVRGEISLAANIIEPIKGQPNKCKLTMLTQVNPGGFAPPLLINNICTMGPPSFYKKVEIAAQTKPSQKVLLEKKLLAQKALEAKKLSSASQGRAS